MEELIELYLFKNKKCPLPEIGTLHLTASNPVAWYAEKRIEAPVPVIKLMESSIPADDFIHFIAERKHISRNEAGLLLKKYCNELQNMDAFGETKLPHAGKFYVNADGNLVFKVMEIPREFLPQVNTERVHHPSASHNMMVGDKETTTTEMAAYYTETEEVSKDKWWIWAIVLSVITIGALALYFSNARYSHTFGNSSQIQPAATINTYRIAE